MLNHAKKALMDAVTQEQPAILTEWLAYLQDARVSDTGRISDADMQKQAKEVLALVCRVLAAGETDREMHAFTPLKDLIDEICRSRATQGFSPTEVATFVLSIKVPIYNAIRRYHGETAVIVADSTWVAARLIDQLGLHTMEVFHANSEAVIGRQSVEIAELSTPVVRLWDGILAVPLIGTIDAGRASGVMETLLQAIVDNAAEIAIIDITGVPTVDTMVAQYLFKTIASARLMGADCIISGIRPQIAQTMVHLGIELNVVSKATLADAFALALRRTGRTVTKVGSAAVARQAV